MKLIKQIEIQRFKSIRSSSLNDLEDFNVLAGLNNSGKSNFLRALNVFFNNQIDIDTLIYVDRDYYRPEVKSRKKKEIQISVYFDLPEVFNFRNKLEPVEKLLGRQFKISKKWSRDSAEALVFLNDSQDPLNKEDSDKVELFLSLISFRMIPNRVIPTDIIKRELKCSLLSRPILPRWAVQIFCATANAGPVKSSPEKTVQGVL